MKNCKYGCNFWVDTEDDHPNIITETTGIQPTKISIKGRKIINDKGRTFIQKQNLWELHGLKRVASDEWNICDCIEDITDILDSQEVLFRQIFQKYENKGILIYGDVYHYWIQFRIQPEILYKMKKYNILIDFSIMSFNEEE